MERHYTPDELARYAATPSTFPEARKLEEHIAACQACGDELDAIRSFEAALMEEETWRLIDDASMDMRREPLRDLKERIEKEDAEATTMLVRHLSSPLRFMWAGIARKRRFRTGGVVRILCRASADVREQNPLHAMYLAEAAAAIAEALPDDWYPARGISHLRGLAWKEYANACRYLGRFDAALDAINRAERAYRRLLSNETELGIVDYLRGTVLWKQERLEEALAYARKSNEAFSALRDRDRWVNARLLEGAILGDMQAYEAAQDIFAQLHEAAEEGGDPLVLARVLHGLGNICTDVGDFGNASVHLLDALQLYSVLDVSSEMARVRWSIAVLALVSGNVAEACLRLAAARDECIALDMLTDAALITLDLIEANVVLDRRSDIRRLCGEVLERVKVAGMVPAALRAVAYLRECSDRGRAYESRHSSRQDVPSPS